MNSEMEDVDWNIFCDWNTLSGQDICSAIQMLMMTNQNIVKSDWDSVCADPVDQMILVRHLGSMFWLLPVEQVYFVLCQ